jgi:hypothetical protein
MGFVPVRDTRNGDGLLNQGIGGYVGSAPACYNGTLSSNSDFPQKIINGRHKQRSAQHTARKKIYKINISDRAQVLVVSS